MNMSDFVQPKSDQMNADDLIGGPRTIRITRVSGNEGNAEQPVNVFFDGDDGKPYRPCKSMRRVMLACWGAEAKSYVGRSMTLYRDPKVKWGGMEVGGIRISHMSHIDREQTLALTETRAKRTPYVVKPLADAPEPVSDDQREKIQAEAERHAKQGTDAFKAWYKANPDKRTVAQENMAHYQTLAQEADKALAAGDDDPFGLPSAEEKAAAMEAAKAAAMEQSE